MSKYFVLTLLFLTQIFSQTTPIDSVGDRWPNMYPLELGNYWVFSESNGEHFNTERIVADTILDNGKNYFTMERFLDNRKGRTHFIRLDSTGTLYQIREGIDDVEFPIMEFNVKVNDSILAINEIDYYIVTDIYLDEYGRIVIVLEYSSEIIGSYNTWIEHIGHFSYGGEGAYNQLAGAYLGGVLTGDTINYTNIDNPEDHSFIPDHFDLSQNYPNPFNPTSTIRYTIPKSSHVKVEVFNIKGQKVKTLANGRMSPGTYEATFDGSNLASGVYIYRMVAGDFTFVKKMIFMK